MKPYGQKKKKSKLGVHSSDKCGCEACNNSNWKIMKSRDRNLLDFGEISEDIEYLEMGDFWCACYVPLGISIIGKTKEDCLGGMEAAYNSHK